LKLGFLKKLKLTLPQVKVDRSDILFLLGGAAVCAGIWMLKPAAGVIAAGLFLVLLAISLSKPTGG